MKISLILTPRLVVILSACAITIVLLLLMLGFELGLRQAHEDAMAQAKSRGEPVYGAGIASSAKRVDSSSSAAGSASNSASNSVSGNETSGHADAANGHDHRRGAP
ncbi:MAG: hypothetical protein ACKO2S_09180 [Burkholderiaceae bacterium]